MIGMMIVSGYLFKKIAEKSVSIRAFEPPWGKRKAPAFVSKAGQTVKEATLHLSDRHTKLFKKDEEHGGQAHISTCGPFLKAFINYKAIEIKATTKSCAKSPIFILFLKILI